MANSKSTPLTVVQNRILAGVEFKNSFDPQAFRYIKWFNFLGNAHFIDERVQFLGFAAIGAQRKCLVLHNTPEAAARYIDDTARIGAFTVEVLKNEIFDDRVPTGTRTQRVAHHLRVPLLGNETVAAALLAVGYSDSTVVFRPSPGASVRGFWDEQSPACTDIPHQSILLKPASDIQRVGMVVVS